MLPDDRTRLKALTRAFSGARRAITSCRAAGRRSVGATGTSARRRCGTRRVSARPHGSRSSAWRPSCCGRCGLAYRQACGCRNSWKKHHPEEPHWYLMLIGSDPSVRGAGFGQALMRSRLDRCDAERVPRISRTAIRRTSRTICGSDSRSWARSSCRTGGRLCGRCGGSHDDRRDRVAACSRASRCAEVAGAALAPGVLGA